MTAFPKCPVPNCGGQITLEFFVGGVRAVCIAGHSFEVLPKCLQVEAMKQRNSRKGLTDGDKRGYRNRDSQSRTNQKGKQKSAIGRGIR